MSELQNLEGKEAAEKIKALVNAISSCMFCTHLGSVPFTARPMGSIKVEDDGSIYFFSNRNSSKNAEIGQNGNVQLLYSNPGSAEFLCVYGTAEIITDKQKARELWTPLAKAWFDSPEDPNLTIIRVAPVNGHYWDTKYNKMVTMAKIAAAAITGKNADAGVEGNLNTK